MDIKDNIKMQEGISFLNLIENNKILVPIIQRDYAQGRLDIKVSEIRDNFLSSIFEVLTTKDCAPLLLDFIYGSTQNDLFIPLDGQQRLTTLFLLHWYFIPKNNRSLLFLTEGNSCDSLFSYETRISSKDFCNAFVTKSSVELQNELENYKVSLQTQIEQAEGILNELENKSSIEPSDIEKKRNTISQINILKKEKSLAYLSTIIKNQPWFMWSWRKDPTVKAMLVMLDEIDARVKDISEEAQNNIWEQLVKGKIIFHLLPLEQFELTDELYVKMNARGKELSPFDVFKSSLEEQMRVNNVDETIQNKWRKNIDSNWIDLFWNKFAKNAISDAALLENQKKIVDSVEQGFLIFLKRIIGLFFIEKGSLYNYNIKDANIRRLMPFEDYDENNIKRKLLDQAIQKDVANLFPLFYKTRFFDESFFKYAIDVFDNLIYLDENGLKHDASELIDSVRLSKEKSSVFDLFMTESADYESFLLFSAMINFCIANKTKKIVSNESLKTEFNSWIRIVRNLSTLLNTFIDDIEDFQATLIAYQSWCKEVYDDSEYKSINKYFAAHPKKNLPKGRLINDQFEEEITKAILIDNNKNGKEWLNSINKIEEHGYFLGQIRFLLNWSKVDEQYDLGKFKLLKNAIIEIFDSNGLKEELTDKENHLFRNCLMANCENYLLLKDDCFVNNTGKERDRSWKSYLRNSHKSQNIKTLLDKFIDRGSISFIDFCKNEIDNSKKTILDWRRCFLIKPEIYNRCEQNQIDYWDKNKMEICLLETSKKWIGFNRHSELNTYYWFLVFNGQNNWIAKYYNSQTETPLTTFFVKEQMNVNVCFENNNGAYSYRIELNFNPEESDFLNLNNNWSKHYDTNDFAILERFLMKILI